MNVRGQAQRVREGMWLHTGDILSTTDTGGKGARVVSIEKIIYNSDLTRSFVLAPVDAVNPKLYRSLTSEKTLRQKYRRLNTNEVRII